MKSVKGFISTHHYPNHLAFNSNRTEEQAGEQKSLFVINCEVDPEQMTQKWFTGVIYQDVKSESENTQSWKYLANFQVCITYKQTYSQQCRSNFHRWVLCEWQNS